MIRRIFAGLCLLLLSGCLSYTWFSDVPEDRRSVAVPVFENESGYPELDALVTQAILREIQREGTMKISRKDQAALVLHGKLLKSSTESLSFDRNYGSRTSEYRYTVTAAFSVWEASTGKMLIRDQKVSANTTFLSRGDMLTGLQDAFPRLAAEMARSVVDSLLVVAASE